MARGIGGISWFDNPPDWRPTVKVAPRLKPITDENGRIIGYGDPELDEYGQPVSTRTIPTGFKSQSDIDNEAKDRLSRALEDTRSTSRIEAARAGAEAKVETAKTGAEAKTETAKTGAEAGKTIAQIRAKSVVDAARLKQKKQTNNYTFDGLAEVTGNTAKDTQEPAEGGPSVEQVMGYIKNLEATALKRKLTAEEQVDLDQMRTFVKGK